VSEPVLGSNKQPFQRELELFTRSKVVMAWRWPHTSN
jgi:hypothetical protein